MEHLSRSRQSFKTLSKEQKAAFVFVTIIGIAGVVLGTLSFYAYAKRPFEIQLAEYAKKGRVYTLDQQEAQEVEAQKTRDTDADGLTDYDELYVFKTSAYLSDTDSDGRDDKTEVFEGTDPNCSDTKGCAVVTEVPVDTAGLAVGNPLPVEQSTFNSPELDQLLQLQQQLQGLQGTSGTGTIPTTTPTEGAVEIPADVLAYINSLPIERIRDSALSAGFPQAELEKLDDVSLRQLFLESIKQAAAKGELSIEAIKASLPATTNTSDTPTTF